MTHFRSVVSITKRDKTQNNAIRTGSNFTQINLTRLVTTVWYLVDENLTRAMVARRKSTSIDCVRRIVEYVDQKRI